MKNPFKATETPGRLEIRNYESIHDIEYETIDRLLNEAWNLRRNIPLRDVLLKSAKELIQTMIDNPMTEYMPISDKTKGTV